MTCVSKTAPERCSSPAFIHFEENVSTQSFVFITGFTVGVLKFIVFRGSAGNDFFLCLEYKAKCSLNGVYGFVKKD